MCTAISCNFNKHYFGRNLDVECSYDEKITIAPRNFCLRLRCEEDMKSHYAIIGMAAVVKGYPLYFDATNEKGLSVAGLRFTNFERYCDYDDTKYNISPFELIPWILGQCKTTDDARKVLSKTNPVNINFSDELKLSPLHWIVSDKEKSITVEPTQQGFMIFDNAVGVLTNNPEFDIQMFNLNNYMSLSRKSPVNNFSDKLMLTEYSRGMGAMGLPGDLSSQSRFVRAVFTKYNSIYGSGEKEDLSQFFHILYSVYQQKGCTELEDGKFEFSTYTSCCDTDNGIYYYTTYDNHQISAVDMYNENLNKHTLVIYPLVKSQQIFKQN